MDISQIEQLILPLLEQESAELVDLQFRQEGHRWVLRVFLDKEAGITLDDCSYFSDRIGALLDEKDAIQKSYVLEVSSPGLDRVIKKETDFKKFAGKAVRMRLKVPQEGQRNFKGKLLGFEAGKVLLEAGGKRHHFAPELIDEARLDWQAEV